MQTKFNLGDTVYIPVTVTEVRIKKDGRIIYTVATPNDTYNYYEESELRGEINNGETDISSEV